MTELVEMWRPISGYEGIYEVSNTGKVRSLDRVTSAGRRIKGKELTPVGVDYNDVQLWQNNVGKVASIHRLVATAFLPNPENNPEVNHIDDNRKNNLVTNLEWVTSKENTAHRLKGHKRCQSYRKPIKCLETQLIFPSISKAGASVSASTQQIIDSIESKSCCKGYTFVYTDFDGDEKSYMEAAHAKYQDYHKRPSMPNSRKVKCIESGQIFDSVAEASRAFNCDTATINNRIEAKKSFKGATLVYVD